MGGTETWGSLQFKASSVYIVRHCLKTKSKTKQNPMCSINSNLSFNVWCLGHPHWTHSTDMLLKPALGQGLCLFFSNYWLRLLLCHTWVWFHSLFQTPHPSPEEVSFSFPIELFNVASKIQAKYLCVWCPIKTVHSLSFCGETVHFQASSSCFHIAKNQKGWRVMLTW